MRWLREYGPLLPLFAVGAAWLSAQAYTVYMAGTLTGWRL